MTIKPRQTLGRLTSPAHQPSLQPGSRTRVSLPHAANLVCLVVIYRFMKKLKLSTWLKAELFEVKRKDNCGIIHRRCLDNIYRA